VLRAVAQRPTWAELFNIVSSLRLPGWRRSADRTRLQANSLLTGNFTGKIAISGLKELIW
jgi:hypothetical protein